MNTVELYPKGLWHKLEYQLSGYDTAAPTSAREVAKNLKAEGMKVETREVNLARGERIGEALTAALTLSIGFIIGMVICSGWMV